MPAYVIFHDATLRQIATDAPATLAELSRVSGVGENKLAKYGEQILAVLAAEPLRLITPRGSTGRAPRTPAADQGRAPGGGPALRWLRGRWGQLVA